MYCELYGHVWRILSLLSQRSIYGNCHQVPFQLQSLSSLSGLWNHTDYQLYYYSVKKKNFLQQPFNQSKSELERWIQSDSLLLLHLFVFRLANQLVGHIQKTHIRRQTVSHILHIVFRSRARDPAALRSMAIAAIMCLQRTPRNLNQISPFLRFVQ